MYVVTSQLLQQNNCLGFMNKENVFVAVTNWSAEVVGVVREGTRMIGIILRHLPQTASPGTEESFQSYLSLRDMSCQNTIRERLCNGESLWIAPSKDQFLPPFLQDLANKYNNQDDAKVLKPLKRYGCQNDGNNCSWVLPSKTGCQLISLDSDGKLTTMSPSEMDMVDTIKTKGQQRFCLHEEILDSNLPMIQLVEFLKNNYKDDFTSTIAVLASTAIAFHFPSLKNQLEGVPIPVVIGEPGNGKSTVCRLAMESICISGKCQQSTYNGMYKLIQENEYPLWIEDLIDFKIWEDLVMIVYNQAAKVTAAVDLNESNTPIGMPFFTTNGFSKNIGDAVSFERTLGRSVVIPFTSKKKFRNIKVSESFHFEGNLKEALELAQNSFGFILKLHLRFKELKNDLGTLQQLDEVLEAYNYDVRSQKNYAILLYSMSLILQACNIPMKEALDIMKGFMEKSHLFTESMSQNNQQKKLLEELLIKSLQTHWGKKWIVRGKATSCGCGEILSFNLPYLLNELADPKFHRNALKQAINEIGCSNRTMKYSLSGGIRKPCFHVRISALSTAVTSLLNVGESDLENDVASSDFEFEIESHTVSDGANPATIQNNSILSDNIAPAINQSNNILDDNVTPLTSQSSNILDGNANPLTSQSTVLDDNVTPLTSQSNDIISDNVTPLTIQSSNILVDNVATVINQSNKILGNKLTPAAGQSNVMLSDNTTPATSQSNKIGDNIAPAIDQSNNTLGDNVTLLTCQSNNISVTPSTSQNSNIIGDNITPAINQSSNILGDNMISLANQINGTLDDVTRANTQGKRNGNGQVKSRKKKKTEADSLHDTLYVQKDGKRVIGRR